jgi:predicted DNA-binding transcriptional regulator YafY
MTNNRTSKTGNFMAQLHPDTLLRQWQMLRIIPRYPHKITAKSLHEKLKLEQFDVTKRTVERDLLSLSEMFPLVSDERDKPYGWSWSKDAPLFNLPGLSHNEALTLTMVEQHLNSLLPASTLSQLQHYFKTAKQHLSNIPQNERTRSWLNKVRTVPTWQPLLPPTIKPSVQYTVYEALLADKQLEIKYLKRGEDKTVEYRIHPLAVVQRGGITYLYCRVFDYADLRILALHRIHSAIMLEEAANIPAGFSIDKEISLGKFGFGEGNQIQLEAIFYHGSGEHLFETALSSDQTLTEKADGSLKLIATVADTPQLVWWLLGFGDGVEVLKPAALRQSIAETISKMQATYKS